ncbi:uncharacterized protein [Palaemon carinicauda]|uniref:uncharacterized protein n=1 Tax=Palaemon carinicauda TaxID=392227 RepID=UPI0035B5F74A
MSQLFNLRVVIPKVAILPPGDRFVKSGSQVQVDCQISDVVQLPDYIFWYREDKRVLDQMDPNMLVTVNQTGPESITSSFFIHKVKREDSGNYTCQPSNLHSASVTLHVLNEEHPAGLQGERNNGTSNTLKTNIFTTLCALLVLIAWSPQIGIFFLCYEEHQILEQEGSGRRKLLPSESASCRKIDSQSSISENSVEFRQPIPEVLKAFDLTSRR